MQVKFRYTNKEFIRSRRFNQMAGTPKWKILTIVPLTLVPSILLSLLSDDGSLLFAVFLVGLILFATIAWVLFRQPKMVDQHDHALTLSPDTLRDEYSHSIFEINWKRFDGFIEEDHEFLFRRLDRFIIFPKRIFTDQQCEEVRKLASTVEQEPSNENPVGLYAKHCVNPNATGESPHLLNHQQRVFEFLYQREDFLLAMQSPLRVIDHFGPPQKNNSVRSKLAPFVSLFIFILLTWTGFVLATQTSLTRFWSFLQVIFVCALPMVLLFVGMWRIRKSNAQRVPQTPDELSKFALTKTGFATGTSQSVTFTDWRDVESFHENDSCWGFKMPNELIQIVPKRIFADEIDSKKFIDLAMMLHREHRQTFAVTVVGVETGNPFQAPNS